MLALTLTLVQSNSAILMGSCDSGAPATAGWAVATKPQTAAAIVAALLVRPSMNFVSLCRILVKRSSIRPALQIAGCGCGYETTAGAALARPKSTVVAQNAGSGLELVVGDGERAVATCRHDCRQGLCVR